MNDEKRREKRKVGIGIYISLIVAAGVMAVMLPMLISYRDVSNDYRFIFLLIPAGGVLVATLLAQVFGLFICSWLTRGHLLLWYACLFAVILIQEYIVSVKPADYLKLADSIMYLGVVVLLILPVIWIWNAFRRLRSE